MTKKPNGKPPKSNGKSELSGKGEDETKSDSKAVNKQTASRQKDEHGRFVLGNTIGVQFQSGESGNPKGRPPKPSMVAAICKLLTKADLQALEGVALFNDDGEPNRAPTTGELGANLLHMAMGGNLQAMTALNTLLERLDGRVPIKAELTGKDGDPIEVRSARDDLLSRIDSQVERIGARENTRKPN